MVSYGERELIRYEYCGKKSCTLQNISLEEIIFMVLNNTNHIFLSNVICILYIVKKIKKYVLGFQINTSGFSDKTWYSSYSPYDEVTVHSLHLLWIIERCKNKDLGKYRLKDFWMPWTIHRGSYYYIHFHIATNMNNIMVEHCSEAQFRN